MPRPIALSLLLLVPALAHGQTPGGGSKITDCLIEFAAGTPVNTPVRRPKKIVCVDNDPTCDAEPAVGACTFQVAICANVTDAKLPGCGPASLERFEVDNVHPDENPGHDFDFQALEDLVTATVFPVDAAESDRCGAPVGIHLVLPVRLGAGRASFAATRKLLRTEAETRSGVVDADKLQMQCRPNRATSPCDDVTSTFDQIQRHILTPGCGRGTCHNAAQPLHELSLAPGATHASLVGVAPFNFTAREAGKLRVDPGDPDNSFLLDKVRGRLARHEGERMPFGLPRLKRAQVRMIEDWIAAGAPATGFVSAQGCQPAP